MPRGKHAPSGTSRLIILLKSLERLELLGLGQKAGKGPADCNSVKSLYDQRNALEQICGFAKVS